MASLISIALILQIFVLLNPLASFPLLIQAYRKKMNVKKIAISAVLTAFIIALIIAMIGPSLFNIFGISVDSFRIAGGVILLLLGIEMISFKHEKTEVDKIDGMISIIATPLLTGPATISFIAIRAYELGQVFIISNLVGAFILVGVVFTLFSISVSKINPKIIGISSKVIGLFVTGVGIEMISKGILNLLV